MKAGQLLSAEGEHRHLPQRLQLLRKDPLVPFAGHELVPARGSLYRQELLPGPYRMYQYVSVCVY